MPNNRIMVSQFTAFGISSGGTIPSTTMKVFTFISNTKMCVAHTAPINAAAGLPIGNFGIVREHMRTKDTPNIRAAKYGLAPSGSVNT